MYFCINHWKHLSVVLSAACKELGWSQWNGKLVMDSKSMIATFKVIEINRFWKFFQVSYQKGFSSTQKHIFVSFDNNIILKYLIFCYWCSIFLDRWKNSVTEVNLSFLRLFLLFWIEFLIHKTEKRWTISFSELVHFWEVGRSIFFIPILRPLIFFVRIESDNLHQYLLKTNWSEIKSLEKLRLL